MGLAESDDPDGEPVDTLEGGGGQGHQDENLDAHDEGGAGDFAEFFFAGGFVDDADDDDQRDDEGEPSVAEVGVEGGEGIEERHEGEEVHAAPPAAGGVGGEEGASGAEGLGLDLAAGSSRVVPVMRRRTSNMTRRLSMPAMPQ